MRGGERVDQIAPDPRGSLGGLIEVVMISFLRILLYSLVTTVECGVAVGGALSVNVKWIQNGVSKLFIQWVESVENGSTYCSFSSFCSVLMLPLWKLFWGWGIVHVKIT